MGDVLPEHEARGTSADDAHVVTVRRLLGAAKKRHDADGVILVDGLGARRGLVVGVPAVRRHVRVHVHIAVAVCERTRGACAPAVGRHSAAVGAGL